MTPSPQLRQGIMAFEGFRETPYRCPGGYGTIGYGHVIETGETFEKITRDEATQLLHEDVAYAAAGVNRLIKVPLTQGQFDALTSFAFNLGTGALQRSTLRQCVNREDHDRVGQELLKWCHVKGKVVPGLLLRRQWEAKLYCGAIQ